MKKWIIIALIIVALLGTIAYIGKKQVDKAMKYCYNYNIKKSKINKISSSGIDISAAIDFKNTSDITFNVDGYSLDILVNGSKISEVKSNAKSDIKANAFTTILVPIRLDLSGTKALSFTSLIKNIATDRSKIIFTIKGKVSGGAFGVKVRDFPLEISMTLAEMMEPSTEPETVCK